MTFFFSILLTLLAVSCSSSPRRPENYREDKNFRAKVKKAAYINIHPKICFDEGHNNLAVEFGFYDPVLALAESDGYEVIRTTKRFTKEVLKGCKILYSSTVAGHPDAGEEEADQSAFDVEEIESIMKWVREGGSLLLMSDHGPQARAASKLLQAFKISGSIESVNFPKGMLSIFSDARIFTLQGRDLNETSPIVLGRNFSERVKKLHYFRGQALKGPSTADLFLRVPTGSKVAGKTNEFKSLGLALRFGRGRVVVIGDGSVFAAKIDERNNEAAGLNRKDNDNAQLATNVFRWLSGAFY